MELLPLTSEGWEDTVFTSVRLSTSGRGTPLWSQVLSQPLVPKSFQGRLPQSQGLSQVSSRRSFPVGTPIISSFLGLWFQVLSRRYPSPRGPRLGYPSAWIGIATPWPIQNSRVSTCYMAGNILLASRKRTFLFLNVLRSVRFIYLHTHTHTHKHTGFPSRILFIRWLILLTNFTNLISHN